MKIGIKQTDILFAITLSVVWPLVIWLAIRSEFDVNRMTFNQWMMIGACVSGGLSIGVVTTNTFYQLAIKKIIALFEELKQLSEIDNISEKPSQIPDELYQEMEYLRTGYELLQRVEKEGDTYEILLQIEEYLNRGREACDEELCDE